MDSRKELINAYKRTPKTMGAYQIRNKLNGKCYVAASKDIVARLNRHRADLKFGGEAVKSLLTDWREFGEENFAFEILDRLEPLDTPDYKPADDLKVLEAIWLDKLQPFEPAGYNPVKTGSRQ
jgi:group I intron endonuclease